MTDEPENLMLQQFRFLRNEILDFRREVGNDLADVKTRLSAIEQHMIGYHLDIASARERLDRIETRLGRIEQRLGLIEA